MASKMDPAITAAIARINKANGSGTVVLGKDINTDLLPRITSGSLTLDVALGGGWVANQWNEVYGDESHGKTALVLKTIAANQARDPNWMTFWVASEHFVPEYARMLGVDVNRVIVLDTNEMELAYGEIIEWADKRLVDCIVLDSLPALVPAREDENAVGELAVGLSPLLTGQFFRKQGKAMKRSMIAEDRPITGFIINQFREKIGVMRGDPRTTPGGRAKNFFYFVRAEVRRDEWIEEGDERVGQVIKIRTVKNKSHRPQQVATLDFHFHDHGDFQAGDYDTIKEIVAVGILYGVVTRAGAYYRYGAEQWQGRAPLVEQLRSDLTLREAIRDEVMIIVRKGNTNEPQIIAEPPEPAPAKKPAGKTRKVAKRK